MGKPINLEYIDDYVIFSLTNRRNKEKEKMRIKVDLFAFNELVRDSECWYIHTSVRKKSYVRMTCYETRKNFHLHREVIALKRELPKYDKYGGDSIVVDHLNGDSLDNRDSELRLATRHINNRNRSNVSGVLYRGCNITNVKSGGYQSYHRSTYIAHRKCIVELRRLIDEFLESNNVRV